MRDLDGRYEGVGQSLRSGL